MKWLLRAVLALAAVAGAALVSPQAGYAETISNTPPVDVNLPGAQACYWMGAGPVVDPCEPIPISRSQTFNYTDDNGADYGTGSGSVNISGGYDPSVSATATANGAVHVDAGGYFWYAFEITAPADINQVPILMVGTASVSGSTETDEGSSSSTAQVLVCAASFSPDVDPVTNSLCSDPVFSTSTLTNLSSVMDLMSGQVYDVELFAEGEAEGFGTDAPPFVGSAFVDPSFSINLPNTQGYSIQYGPGVFPTSSVPEPGSLALLSSGLLGLGLIRRRKHKTV